MLNEKKINSSGGITIPSAMRREIGLEKGEKVKIKMFGNGDIILRRVIGTCIICKQNENLVKIKNKYICKSCIDYINTQNEETKKQN